MISIVICSISETFLTNVRQNILCTIGVPCEILAYNNTETGRGICEVYNLGARDARFEIICFMHEDIDIKTKDWGKKVIQYFRIDNKLGLLGVAGAGYKSLAPTGWGFNGAPVDKIYHANVVQQYKHINRTDLHLYHNPNNEKISRVACVDGLWFCSKKDIVLENPFDESLIKGFHCYDIDLSLQVSQYFKVAVTYEILIHHFSEGQYDRSWWIETIKVHKKWSHLLPLNVSGLSREEIVRIERIAYKYAFKQLIKYRFPLIEILSLLKINYKSRIMSPYIKALIKMSFIRLYIKSIFISKK